MYTCGGPCLAMEGYVYIAVEGSILLWRNMYSCGGLCIAVEGHVLLWRAMYTCGGPCLAMEGHA